MVHKVVKITFIAFHLHVTVDYYDYYVSRPFFSLEKDTEKIVIGHIPKRPKTLYLVKIKVTPYRNYLDNTSDALIMSVAASINF